jgi:hypothetical protein
MRLTATLLVAAATAALAATAGGAPAADVTLRVERFWSEACRCYKFRFAGAISSRAANEYVTVVQQKCGKSFSTSVAGTTTREGGFWEVESNGPVGGGTFRARWNNSLSDPVSHRQDLSVLITRLGGGRVRVGVTSFDLPLKLKGKIVELQRPSAGQWTRVRRARFSVRRPGSFSATFTVKRRGLTLRAFVPAESAAPCYAATASKTWSSGTASPAGSDRIIDGTYSCSVAIQGGIRLLSAFASGLVPTHVSPKRSIGASSNWGEGPLAAATTDSMSLNPARCTASKARVPLAARGLEGGSVGQEHRSFECETPARVLVRIRGVFAAPAAFAEDRTFGYRQLLATGEVANAAVAVRTLGGRPMALASLSASGGVRLFTARNCVDDS